MFTNSASGQSQPSWFPSEQDMMIQTEPGPFVQWIEDYPLPPGGLPKGIEMYDGKSDPDNHLKHFNGMIKMQRWNVPVACHMFALTMKDVARAWVDGLPVGSVVNFEDLKRKFISHFSQQRKYQKIHLEAHNIKIREGESIRSFITRYIDETSLIKGLAKSQKISGFVHGLRFKPLVEFLSTDLPQTYTTLTDKTHSFLLAKDTAGNLGGAEPVEGSPYFNPQPYGRGGGRGRRGRGGRGHHFSPYQRTQDHVQPIMEP
uniref:uncharacterized protein LOC122610316 n=1 Tax=Erigeron canadensis TaxID=72917 RepID=UPI001CB8A263|nr:uncharacterized protein LOC122610316 [Erigeron canadensis]